MPFIVLYSASIYSFFIFAILHFNTAQAIVNFPDNVKISAVFMFGDSIVDTGNNNKLGTLAKCNFPPYGRDFIGGGKPTGRFCNGKVPADIIVEELGLKELLPAYLDPDLTTEDLLTGVNFASAGAGYDPLTSRLVSAISLSQQLEMLKEYIERVKKAVGEERARNITANSLTVISASSNDIANTYYLFPGRILEYNVSGYTELLVNSALRFFEGLQEVGARRIGVFGAPPLGCLPISRTMRGGNARNCVEKYNEAARVFNSKLIKALDDLNKKLPQGKMIYINDYTIFSDIVQNYKKYGFEVSTKGCCGTGTYEVALACNQLSPCTCINASKYVFWDSYHPTETVYRIIVNQVCFLGQLSPHGNGIQDHSQSSHPRFY